MLTFQLVGDENWYEEKLVEIFPNDGIVQFTNRVVDIKNISKIRQFDKNRFGRGLGNKLIIFAGSYAAFSLLGTLVDWELGPDTWIVSGTSLLAGVMLKLIFKHKTHKIGKRKMLRTMSLDFSANMH